MLIITNTKEKMLVWNESWSIFT